MAALFQTARRMPRQRASRPSQTPELARFVYWWFTRGYRKEQSTIEPAAALQRDCRRRRKRNCSWRQRHWPAAKQKQAWKDEELRNLNTTPAPLSPSECLEESLFSSLQQNLGKNTGQRAAQARDEKTLERSDLEESSAPPPSSHLIFSSSKKKTTPSFPQLKWPAPPSSPSSASASRSSPPAQTPCLVRKPKDGLEKRRRKKFAMALAKEELARRSLSLFLFFLPLLLAHLYPPFHPIKFINSRAHALPPREGRR